MKKLYCKMTNETEQIKKNPYQSKKEGESTTLHDQNDESPFPSEF